MLSSTKQHLAGVSVVQLVPMLSLNRHVSLFGIEIVIVLVSTLLVVVDALSEYPPPHSLRKGNPLLRTNLEQTIILLVSTLRT